MLLPTYESETNQMKVLKCECLSVLLISVKYTDSAFIQIIQFQARWLFFFLAAWSPTLRAAGRPLCLKMSDANRDMVHQNSAMHFLCIRTHHADRNREGSTWGEEVSGRSACWSSTMWLKRVAVKGLLERDKMLKCKIVMFSTMKMEPL